MNEFKLLTAKQVKADQDSISKNAESLEHQIHTNLCQCIAHAERFGDIRLVDRLRSVLPRGMFNEGFRQFVQKFSPIRWDISGVVSLLKPSDKGYKAFDLTGALASSFEKVKPRVNEAMLDLEKLIGLVKGMEGRIDRAKEQGKIISIQEEKMRSYVRKLMAVQAPALSKMEDGTVTTPEVTVSKPRLIKAAAPAKKAEPVIKQAAAA